MTIRRPAACWNTGTAIVAVALICSLATAIPAQAQNAEPPAWAAFKDIWKNVTSYSATVIVFEREGTQVQSSVLDYTFRKPSSATVHFSGGPNAGVTLVWNGGNTVVVHRGTGLIALFKKTSSRDDDPSIIDRSAQLCSDPRSCAGDAENSVPRRRSGDPRHPD